MKTEVGEERGVGEAVRDGLRWTPQERETGRGERKAAEVLRR